MKREYDLILASQSPRRARILDSLNLQYKVAPANIDETARPGERPLSLVRRLAAMKAITVAQHFPSSLILGADTMVALGDQLLGKPRDSDEAFAMLSTLSGRSHNVYTGVAVWDSARKKGYGLQTVAIVTFRPLSTFEMREYIASGEPMDKAGAYAIQGRAGKWVQKLDGNLETVIGLSSDAVKQLLRHWR